MAESFVQGQVPENCVFQLKKQLKQKSRLPDIREQLEIRQPHGRNNNFSTPSKFIYKNLYFFQQFHGCFGMIDFKIFGQARCFLYPCC